MTKKMRGTAPIHPGEILLEEFLKRYDPQVSQVDAAARMHIPKVRLNQLIRGNRGITPDTALRLADLTGTSAEFWMNLQIRYDLWQAAQARARRKESRIQPLAKASQLRPDPVVSFKSSLRPSDRMTTPFTHSCWRSKERNK